MSENPADPDDSEDREGHDHHKDHQSPEGPTGHAPRSGDDPEFGDTDPEFGDEPAAEDIPTPEDVRDELYGESSGSDLERPMESLDEGIVDLLSWGLDTETRARIYVRLRQRPRATSEEVAEATGLYPSTVREALAALHDEGIVERRKRRDPGGGNDPYEYTAIAPSDLVGELAERIQDELNAVFDLGRSPDRDATGPATDTTDSTTTAEPTTTTEPVTITVRDAGDAADESDDHDTDDHGDA